jgi:hypothetical protein
MFLAIQKLMSIARDSYLHIVHVALLIAPYELTFSYLRNKTIHFF